LVIELQKIRQTHDLPASEQTASNLLILLGALGLNKDLVAVNIHQIKRVKFAIIFYISWAHQIGLVNVTDV
jgi:hypothetical protein